MTDPLYDGVQPASLSLAAAAKRTEIVFIEDDVTDLAAVVDGLRPDIEFVVLDSKANGLDQIAAHLQGRGGIDAVHIVSHGGQGVVQLGTASLSNATIGTHAGALGAIGAALADGADILLYGCAVGAGATGQALLQSLATLSHADVAASDDATGAAALGGDWLLESQVGRIDSVNPFTGAFADAYAGVFAGTYGDAVVTTGEFMMAAARPGQAGTLWVNDGGVANAPWDGSGEGRELSFMVERIFYPATYDTGLRGRFEYDTGDGQWHTLLVTYTDSGSQPPIRHDNGGTPAPYGATVRYIDERPNDTTTQEMHIRFWDPVNETGFNTSSFKVAADLAPTGIGANTLNLWSNTATGAAVTALNPIDTGLAEGGLYELVGQSEAGLFALNGNLLVKGSGQLAAGQTASVTLRYYDAFGRHPDGTPIPGQGVEQTLTFIGRANPPGLGPEVHVNTSTAGSQNNPQVASQDDGSYMITWTSGSSVMGQKFDAAGASVGAEIAIAPAGYTSAIAALDGGRYAVAYVANGSDVKIRIVGADGTVGAATSGPSNAANEQWYPVMTKLVNGGFALAWANSSANYDWDIMARAFDANGVAVAGSESIVHTVSAGRQWNPGIGTLSDGHYVVTWEAKDDDYDNTGTVMVQVMGAGGPVGAGITVAENAAMSVYPKVAGLAGGGFVVVYEASGTTEGGVTDSAYNHNVHARIYDAAGHPAGPAFLVNTDVAGNQQQGVVIGLNDGGFAIAWVSNTDPTGNSDVFGRSYDADGTPRQDNDMLLNESGRGNYQNQLALTPHGASGFVATWTDADADGVDNNGVTARVVDPNAGNHKPHLAGGATLDAIVEDVVSLDVENVADSANPPPNPGMDVADLVGHSGYVDADGDVVVGIAISANAADPLTEGRWQYANDADAKFWKDVGAVSASSALLLPVASATTFIRFVPVADYHGAPGGLTVHAIDATGANLPYSLWDGATETGQRLDLGTFDGTGPVSNGVTWGAQVTSVNDAPLITHLDHADDRSFTVGGDAVLVDLGGDAAVADVDNASFAGGTLNVKVIARDARDVLGLKGGPGVAARDEFVAGSEVTVDGQVIGTVTLTSHGYAFAIDLNANATPAAIATLLRHLTFSTTGVDGVRTVRATLDDGAGGHSASGASDTFVTVVSNPSVTIVSDKAALKAGETAHLTLTFNKAPVGLDGADFVVAGGAVDNLQPVAGNPLQYTATFTPGADHQDLHATVAIAAGAFMDADGKFNTASNVVDIHADTRAPTVSISASASTVKAGDVATLTFTFSEAPVGFGDGAVSVAGGQLTNLHATTGDNKTWEATFTPAANTAAVSGQIKLAAGAYRDAAGNDGTASNVVAIGGDTQKPVVTPGAFTVAGATGPDDTFRIGDTVTVTWTGDANTDIDKVLVDLRDFGSIDAVQATFGNGKWTASYAVGASGFDGNDAYVAVTVVDRAGNDTWSVVREDIKLDNRVPFVRDNAIDLSGTPTGLDGSWRIGDTITATWTPGGITTDTARVAMDFGQFGASAAVSASLVNGKWVASYTIAAAVLPNGPRNVHVTATDDVGNTDSAYDSSNPVIDAARPAVKDIVVVGAPAANATSVQFKVTLSEAVTGLDMDDFALHGTGASTATITGIGGSGDTYTVTVANIAGNGSLRLDLKDSGTAVVDAAGNQAAGYTGGAVHTVAFNLAPTLGAIGTLAGGAEDTVKAISLADLRAAGDALDTDGDVDAFVVKAVSGGTLKIGASAATASAWTAGANDVIDATHLAFWTPAHDASGSALAAFTVVARDDDGALSGTPVQVNVAVAAVNDPPTLAHGASLASIQEDPAANPGHKISSLLVASGYADVDNGGAGIAVSSIVISANAADALTEGRWEYALAPANPAWTAIGGVSVAAPLEVPVGALLRFVPVADYAGTPGALTVHAVDAADGALSNGVAWTIAVDAVNDKPVIGNLGHGDDQTVNIDDAPAPIDLGANATVTDVDDASFAGGRLEAAIATGADAADILGVKTDARVTQVNGVVSIDGVAIGTRASATGLAFDLNADATAARVATLLQHLTFDTTGAVTGARTVQVTLADGAGAVSDIAATTITVVRNPTLAISSTVTTLRAGETATLSLDFSSAPTGFTLADLDVTGGAVSDLQATADPRKFTATFTPAAAQALDAAIAVKGGVFTDANGLGNAAAAALVAFDGDTLAPGVQQITLLGAPAADAATVQFQVKLSEAVTGLDAADFALTQTGATTAVIGDVTGSGDTYTVTVKDIAGSGSLRLDLKAGGTGIADAQGNAVAGGFATGAVHAAAFNAAPVITSNGGLAQATIKVAEKVAGVATVLAGDADHDTLVYSIDGGADAALFTIDAATGVLKFRQAPALATGANADNSYDVKVSVSDGHGGSDSQSLTVQVERDGNGDGIPDAAQPNVGSIPALAPNNPYVTLEVAGGYTLGGLGASAAPSPLPRGVKMPLGQLDFTIGNVAIGGTVEVSIYVDASEKVNSYYKKDNSNNWKNIAKSVTTSADGTRTKITFDLTDGGPLDSDGVANGSISDPGGVAVMTPQITSNGGELAGSAQVAENGRVVTTVSASASGAVGYAIVGGEDAALFKIDARTGVLSFIDAPNFENPTDRGDGLHNNTYVVQVQATDLPVDGLDRELRSEIQTLTVHVTDVDETAPAKEDTVDGVKVVTGTQVNADGSSSRVVDIAVVLPGRADSVGGDDVADIALASDGGRTLLGAQLPTGYGMRVVGQDNPGSAGASLADLVREIKAHTASGSVDQGKLVDGGTGFLGSLDGATPLLVQSVTLTSATGASGAAAVVLSGLPAASGGVRTALVIDTGALSGTTHVQLQNVDFAAIIGAAHVTGGDGSQKVWGDSANQYIMLGADDDTLHGGDGDDTVGSAGGDDHIYGDGGNDVVFGGIGNDVIDGGSGTDTILMTGAGRADYSLRVRDGKLVSTALHGGDGIDTIVDVEILQFSGADTTAAGTIGRLYEAMLGRAADTAGREFWVGQHAAGVAMGDIAAAIVDSGEAQHQQLDDMQFVTQMYRTLLQRTGDTGGMAFWTKQLADGAVSRAGLALAFADSAEKLAMPSSAQLDFNHSDVATLVRMYEALFDRAPDEGGLNFWIGAHESGVTMRTLAQGFLASSESSAHYATLDDAHFVAELYETAFGHAPSAAQASDWAARLAGGATTRADVLLGIADSDEMVQLVGAVSTSIATV